jgi:hypothetical protein
VGRVVVLVGTPERRHGHLLAPRRAVALAALRVRRGRSRGAAPGSPLIFRPAHCRRWVILDGVHPASSCPGRGRSCPPAVRILAGAGSPAGEPLESAAESTAGLGQRTAGLSGDLIDAHNDFVSTQTRDLSHAGRTDTRLESYLGTAATVTHSGARQLDAIAAQTHTIAQSAAGARTPAAQRMVLAALRSQVSQAKNVVTTDLGTRQVAVPACGGWASRKKKGPGQPNRYRCWPGVRVCLGGVRVVRAPRW